MLNRDLLVRDPVKAEIPNQGVAEVLEPQTPEERQVLRYELTSFVCEGEYERGLDKILSTFLKNLGNPKQPGVWISGFFGSGKSHLSRVLQYLWRDFTFPEDGATARDLVKVTPGIKAHLLELAAAGKRLGGLHAAAGKLGAGAGNSLRLALLNIIFRSVGLPEQYPVARFILWLKASGFYEQVRQGVEASGRSFETEVRKMYVSPYVAQALLQAYPGFAVTEGDARSLLKTQFPNPEDISLDQMVEAMAEALAPNGVVMPCTLIVLDELQQYIGDNGERTLGVQDVEEACSSRFGGRVLFIGTGQSALHGTPQLQKLLGRFPATVELSDTDVERVTRQIVLRKSTEKVTDLQQVLDKCSGEIDRQLVGTKVEARLEDKAVLLQDYPLLPIRRRFWERVLRSVDRSGSAAQLRTQLRIVHEAVRAVANQPVGTVVAGDFIYDQLAPDMLRSGVLLSDIDAIVRKHRDGTPEGELKSRLCAATFLIGQLPTEAGADTGIRATADVLSDLLVEDLLAGSTALRQTIPGALSELVTQGDLMQVDNEYRLQTREGANWEADYRSRYTKVTNDEPRLASERATRLRLAVTTALKDIKLMQGASKNPRKIELHFSADAPAVRTGAVPIWVRDEWSVSEKSVREDSQAEGSDSGTIFAFLPRRGADELKKALADAAAAEETLQSRGTPSTHAGEEARAAMETRLRSSRFRMDAIIADILVNARVFQGGGNEKGAPTLRASVEAAAQDSLVRIYTEFGVADDSRWDKVAERARQGNTDPLSALEFQGDVEKHPACARVLQAVGAGKKGSDLRREFSNPPYGWPQDAVDGAIFALLAVGLLRGTLDGVQLSAKQLDKSKIGVAEFRKEGFTLTVAQRIGVRKLMSELFIPFKNNEEVSASPKLLETLLSLAKQAGGPAPLPEVPAVQHIVALGSVSGNEQMTELYIKREQLIKDAHAWREAGIKAVARIPRWNVLHKLYSFASSLPVAPSVAEPIKAIDENRALLTDPDPVPELIEQLKDALRKALQDARSTYEMVHAAKMTSLIGQTTWQKLAIVQQDQILGELGLRAVPALGVGTEEELLSSLSGISLTEWKNRTDALGERFSKALLMAARLLEPKAVRMALPAATLQSEADVEAYLAKVRELILGHVREGNPVIL